MPQGLQIFAPDGSTLLDANTVTSRQIGMLRLSKEEIPHSPSYGEITVNKDQNKKLWWTVVANGEFHDVTVGSGDTNPNRSVLIYSRQLPDGEVVSLDYTHATIFYGEY
ncbi:hypothetical protein [Oleisolibacter albus]|uniref:hypothetical protein n=1 Tax=Oleisolibacter albus TaxID=2171757 RepID=UPI0012D75DBB|nr:hypothetical protein [Oleisolibacter albus]